MSKNRVFIITAICFAAGILVESRFFISRLYLYGLFGTLDLLLLACILLRKKTGIWISAFFIFVVCGMMRLSSTIVPNEFTNLFGQKIEMEGFISQDTDIRQNKQFLTIRPKGYSQNILVSATLGKEYFYGDWVLVSGKITEPKAFDDFDYEKYLQRFNVYGTVSYGKVLVLKSHKQSFFVELMLRIKQVFVNRISRELQDPESSLLLGILIGSKKNLPQEIIDNFNNTGTSHIIAISGFNITIIISGLAFLAKYIGRRPVFWLSLSVIIAFVIAAGASASVVRAAIMGALLLIALNISRQYAVSSALFFAAFVMLLVNPRILYWDVGFQLSFAATMGIIYFLPLFEKMTEHWGILFGLKSLVLTTMSAIIATMPLILLQFGTLSIIAPLVNLFILPLLPSVMLLGFLSALPLIGPGFAYVTHFLLIYILQVTKVAAHLPFAVFTVKISTLSFIISIVVIIIVYLFLEYVWFGPVKAPVEGAEEL